MVATTTLEEVSQVGEAISALMTLLVLLYTIRAMRQTAHLAHYASLDEMYFDLLKIAMDHPDWRDPQKIPKSGSAGFSAYSNYAFAVFNFLETIQDRCCPADEMSIMTLLDGGMTEWETENGILSSPGNRYMCETWSVVLKGEAELHRDWWVETLKNPPLMFKTRFVNLINNRVLRASA